MHLLWFSISWCYLDCVAAVRSERRRHTQHRRKISIRERRSSLPSWSTTRWSFCFVVSYLLRPPNLRSFVTHFEVMKAASGNATRVFIGKRASSALSRGDDEAYFAKVSWPLRVSWLFWTWTSEPLEGALWILLVGVRSERTKLTMDSGLRWELAEYFIYCTCFLSHWIFVSFLAVIYVADVLGRWEWENLTLEEGVLVTDLWRRCFHGQPSESVLLWQVLSDARHARP